MLNWITVVLGFQLAGELVGTVTGLPVPGPVIGMVLLLALLLRRGQLPDDLDRLASALLNHLYLYYLPASVGVTAHITLVTSELVPILIAVFVSSALAMIVAGLVLQALMNRGDPVQPERTGQSLRPVDQAPGPERRAGSGQAGDRQPNREADHAV